MTLTPEQRQQLLAEANDVGVIEAEDAIHLLDTVDELERRLQDVRELAVVECFDAMCAEFGLRNAVVTFKRAGLDRPVEARVAAALALAAQVAVLDATDTQETPPELSPLRWHYGPTATNPDPGSMWCYDCGRWVIVDKDGSFLCIGCERYAPPEPDTQETP